MTLSLIESVIGLAASAIALAAFCLIATLPTPPNLPAALAKRPFFSSPMVGHGDGYIQVDW